MPEGDAVLRTARRLDRALSGAILTRTDLRVPRFATLDLRGHRIESTIARGKHLLTRIGDDWTLHTHLRMDGSWKLLKPGARWSVASHAVRAVLETETTVALGVLLGVVEVLPRQDEAAAVAHLGPDLLGAEWDEDEALQRLLARAEVPVFDALRDQTVVAGLGTIWAAETLFTMGVHPTTPVGAVPDPTRMLRVARLKLQQAVERSGPMAVYGRDHAPCRRCRTPVRRIAMGAQGRPRPAYFCPSCQPAR